VLNIYDLSPQRLGTFDFVFCSDLLLHLSSPARALENVRSVTRGMALFTEPFDPHLPPRTVAYCGAFDRAVWWSYSVECLQQLIIDAGFEEVEITAQFKTGHRWETPWMWHATFRASASGGDLN
jgi:SAM-dependent methyltransferase